MGYRLDEIVGRHHSIFVEPGYETSAEYLAFWANLRRGEFDRNEYKRIGKGGRKVWLLASYNPVYDSAGKLLRIVKFATDVTREKQRSAEVESQMAAIHRVQGVVEFDLDGTILTANPFFLELMGYSLSEIRGRHHSIFVQPGEADSEEYRAFWKNLRAGHADARVYRRIGKNNKLVWIQASYNPILDLNGRPLKVVKFATDLTDLINETESTQRTAESVAAATAEMSRSIAEISRNMEMSRDATGNIMASSQSSGAEAARLVDSMHSMETIVSLIRGIAGQVDMLALNATIEAARAGDAGKGFAVVANEVKNLSQKTAKATEGIGREIDSVQRISAQVAARIQQSVKDIDLLNQYVNSVAMALEEQSAVTRDISNHSTQMVKAVESILSQTRRSSYNAHRFDLHRRPSSTRDEDFGLPLTA
jgi:methyl-accepting chemotaxis protein